MLLLSACVPAPPSPAPSLNPVASAAAFRCPADPGVAPSGELQAQEVTVARAGDDEPRLYEGPVWLRGALYFSDFVTDAPFPSRIRRFTPPGEVVTVLQDSGSNGLAIGRGGALLAATHDRKQLAEVDLSRGLRTGVVSRFEGEPFNSPNDLVVGADGTIWFTDPAFQRSAAPGGQDATRVYRHRDGATRMVEDTIDNPNGVALSPDGSTLYVSGGGEDGVLRAYPLRDNQAGPGVDIASVSVPDGLAVDCLGNVYVTEHALRRLRVLSPRGLVLATVQLDANVTNAAFGGDDGRTLYITGAGRLWRVSMPVTGLPY